MPDEPAVRVEVMPREQEAHEVGRVDRLDLGAQPVQRVAVDARQQRAIAPLHLGQAGRVGRLGQVGIFEVPAKHDALGLEREQRAVGIRGRNPEVAGEPRGRRRADERQPAAEKLDDGVIARPGPCRARRRRRDGRLQHCVRVDRQQFGQTFGGKPR